MNTATGSPRSSSARATSTPGAVEASPTCSARTLAGATACRRAESPTDTDDAGSGAGGGIVDGSARGGESQLGMARPSERQPTGRDRNRDERYTEEHEGGDGSWFCATAESAWVAAGRTAARCAYGSRHDVTSYARETSSGCQVLEGGRQVLGFHVTHDGVGSGGYFELRVTRLVDRSGAPPADLAAGIRQVRRHHELDGFVRLRGHEHGARRFARRSTRRSLAWPRHGPAGSLH